MTLLLFAARFVREETVSHLFQPKDGEVVAIKSVHNGKYFEVSPTDGRLYATASKPQNKTALFRVMLLSRPMVDMLADAMRTTTVAKWSRRKMNTKSGCTCSGFSALPSAASSQRLPHPPGPSVASRSHADLRPGPPPRAV